MTPSEICHQISQPSRKSLLHQILSEYSRKIRLDNSAQILTSNPEIAETIAQWIQDKNLDPLNSITAVVGGGRSPEEEIDLQKNLDPGLVKTFSISVVKTPKTTDNIYTHAFSHVGGVYNRFDALWALKRCFYALIPKGVAIVTLMIRNPVERVVGEVLAGGVLGGEEEAVGEEELMRLAEEATFERGKVRLTRREVVIGGEELERLREGLLERVESLMEKPDGWRETFEKVWERETKGTGELVFEAWLVVAMRWDLLCA